VTVQAVTLSQIHPVLDGRNQPIAEPTAFDINTSIQRCLVKAIALHGLGLYIYAGEDLPDGQAPAQAPTPPKATPIRTQRTITIGQQRFLEKLIAEANWTEARFLDYFGITAIAELAMADFDRAMKGLQQAKRRAA
jgi:hypothetical protein